MNEHGVNEHSVNEHGAIAASKQLLHAIVWGEHLTVWELLSPAGRDYVLDAGARRGLDSVQAARLRQGTSPTEERDSFLTGLVRGLRVDFSSVEIENVSPSGEVIELDEGRCEIPLDSPASFGDGRWAAGSVVLSSQQSPEGATSWLVDRINPLVSRSE